MPSPPGAPTRLATASCSRASSAARSFSPSEASAGAANALQSLGQTIPMRLALFAAPQQIRHPRLDISLGDPQASSRGQVFAREYLITGDRESLAGLCQLGSGLQRAALDLHDDRGRHEPEHDEVRLLDKQQPCLGLDLRVVAAIPAPAQSRRGRRE